MDPFWTGALLSLSLCLDLGIVNVAAIRAAVQHGPAASFALGVGSCCGDLIYAGLALLGAAAALQLPAVRWALWIGGSGVLLWLAIGALREACRDGSGTPGAADPTGGSRSRLTGGPRPGPPCARELRSQFAYGVSLALASPSAILWFATIGGAVIATSADGSRETAMLFFAGFFAAGLAWSLAVAIAASQGRRFGATFVRVIGVVSAAIFAALAVKVFVDGYRAL